MRGVREATMRPSVRRLMKHAAIPLLTFFLVGLFVVLQFFSAPSALGNLRSLAPAETSSPAATLQGFRTQVSRASQLLLEAYRQNKAEPGFFWSQAVKDKVKEAESLLGRAARTLDLSQVPPVELDHRRLEATLLLKEILDRVPLPPANELPGIDQTIQSWNVPGTEIRIVRMPDGPRAGEYLFSSETVNLLPDFYELVRNEPNTNGATEDFYDFFSQSPGYLLPPKWFALIEACLLVPDRDQRAGGMAMDRARARPRRSRIAAVLAWVGWSAPRRVGDPDQTLRSKAYSCRRLWSWRRCSLHASAIIRSILRAPSTTLVERSRKRRISRSCVGNHAVFGRACGPSDFAKSESIDAHLARAAVRIGGIGVALALLI